MHGVLFVVSYIKLNCFTCVYLIINLYVFIFTGSPKRPMLHMLLLGSQVEGIVATALCIRAVRRILLLLVGRLLVVVDVDDGCESSVPA